MERKDFAARDRAGSSDTDTDEEYKQRIVKAKGPDATTIIAIDDILQVRALKNFDRRVSSFKGHRHHQA